MIDYEQYCRIRDDHERRHLTVPQIARELHLDERTVARWLVAEKFQPRRAARRPSKLDPYKPQIVRWLESHPYTAAQIFLRLRESGYSGGDHHRQGLRSPDPSAPDPGLPDPLLRSR
jgi:transposase